MAKSPPDTMQLRCTLNEKRNAIVVQGDSANKLKVTFHRTVRVPDNSNDRKSLLPPDLGKFPLVPVSLYKDRLPPSMAAKDGILLPMYQREAMWVRFESAGCFAIKLHIGGVNVISGEPAKANMATRLRQAKALADGKLIQDYLVVPRQFWLDGICHAPGEVRQFVAMPYGSKYSVEAQVTGEEMVGGLQFDVWAEKSINQHDIDDINRLSVNIRGCCSDISVNIPCDATVYDLKQAIAHMVKTPLPDMRFCFQGKNLGEDSRALTESGVKNDSEIALVLPLRGGGGGPVEMALAAGGRIEQNLIRDITPSGFWDLNNHVSFNVQIVNSNFYSTVTGKRPLKTPIDAETYAKAGLPFFKLYDEPSGISGDFDAVKSVKQLDEDKKKNVGENHLPDEDINPRVVEILPLNVITQLNPIEEMERLVRNMNHTTF